MILNINKPKDWTSHDVVAFIKGKSGFKKVGHAGTLDPLATGVLVVLTGKDTKKQDKVMHSTKEYVCDITFGVSSGTYDLEGPIEFHEKVPEIAHIKEELPKIITKYLGEFEQKVPPFSAVKVKGKKLYEMARKGNQMDNENLPVKLVEVKNIEIIDIFEKKVTKDGNEYNLPTVKLKIVSSAGFYVRSLAYDLGKDINSEAILTDLVRTRVGDYKIEDSLVLKDITFESDHYYV
jgi:tRNA pseudouridine55 synthase